MTNPLSSLLRKLRFALFVAAGLGAGTALAGHELDKSFTTAASEKAALAAIQATPERHVMILFGDHEN